VKNDLTDDISNYSEKEEKMNKETHMKANNEFELTESVDILLGFFDENSVQKLKQNNFSENGSMTSSKNYVENSQDKFKKVRGFNFKNNINTQKPKPPRPIKPQDSSNSVLISNQTTGMKTNSNEHDNKSNLLSPVNKTFHFEEKTKMRKLNLNSNNIKKFMKQEMTSSCVQAEKFENPYDIELEIEENVSSKQNQ